MKYLLSLKSYRRVRGHDGQGFEARLYWNGKPCADIFDDGWGGEYQIVSRSEVEKERLKVVEEKIATLPPYDLGTQQPGDTPSLTDPVLTWVLGDLVAIADPLVDTKGSPFAQNPDDQYEIQNYKLSGGKRIKKAEWPRLAQLLRDEFPEWRVWEKAEFELDEMYPEVADA